MQQLKAKINITLPMPPSANRYWRKGKNGTLYISDEAKTYKQQVWLKNMIKKPITDAVKISVNVFRARKSGDLDNKLKVLFDALQGVIYKDDSQIVEIHAFRFDDKSNPRVEVEIEEL